MPYIFQYVVPGYIFIRIWGAITQRKLSGTSVWIWSCIISFVTLVAIQVCVSTADVALAVWQSCALSIAADAIVSLVCALVYRTKLFQKLTLHLFGITPIDDTISNVIDWEKGSNAEVYLKTEECFFLGHVRTVGDGDGDGWICLSAPIKYSLDNRELFNYETRPDVYITIPLSDAKYVKIIN